MKYLLNISEGVIIDADSEEQAVEKAQNMWRPESSDIFREVTLIEELKGE